MFLLEKLPYTFSVSLLTDRCRRIHNGYITIFHHVQLHVVANFNTHQWTFWAQLRYKSLLGTDQKLIRFHGHLKWLCAGVYTINKIVLLGYLLIYSTLSHLFLACYAVCRQYSGNFWKSHHQVSLMMLRNTTLVPSLGLRNGPACEAGLSTGMQREHVPPKKRSYLLIYSTVRNSFLAFCRQYCGDFVFSTIFKKKSNSRDLRKRLIFFQVSDKIKPELLSGLRHLQCARIFLKSGFGI